MNLSDLTDLDWADAAFDCLITLVSGPKTPTALTKRHSINSIAWLENHNIIYYDVGRKLWKLAPWIWEHPLVEDHPDHFFGLAEKGKEVLNTKIWETQERYRGRAGGSRQLGVFTE